MCLLQRSHLNFLGSDPIPLVHIFKTVLVIQLWLNCLLRTHRGIKTYDTMGTNMLRWVAPAAALAGSFSVPEVRWEGLKSAQGKPQGVVMIK